MTLARIVDIETARALAARDGYSIDQSELATHAVVWRGKVERTFTSHKAAAKHAIYLQKWNMEDYNE